MEGQIGRFRSDFAFRGRNDVREELPTSLQRLGGDGRSPGLEASRAG